MARMNGDRPLPSLRRALAVARGEVEAYGMQEAIDAWQAIHTARRFDQLMPWQLGVLQNLRFGQVLSGDPDVVPGLPATYRPYGALKGIETR